MEKTHTHVTYSSVFNIIINYNDDRVLKIWSTYRWFWSYNKCVIIIIIIMLSNSNNRFLVCLRRSKTKIKTVWSLRRLIIFKYVCIMLYFSIHNGTQVVIIHYLPTVVISNDNLSVIQYNQKTSVLLILWYGHLCWFKKYIIITSINKPTDCSLTNG